MASRTYRVTASVNPCGKTYEGRNPNGDVLTIQDFRNPGFACPALLAGPLSATETVNGRTTTWFGKERTPATVYPADATFLTAHTGGGGFTPPPPPGSSCNWGAQYFSLKLASKTVKYEVCKFTDMSQPLQKVTGERVLTDAELARVVAAAKGVTISTTQVCGADKPLLTMTVGTPTGSVQYTDDFYSCSGNGPFVDNIDGVFAAFRAVTGTSI